MEEHHTEVMIKREKRPDGLAEAMGHAAFDDGKAPRVAGVPRRLPTAGHSLFPRYGIGFRSASDAIEDHSAWAQ